MRPVPATVPNHGDRSHNRPLPLGTVPCDGTGTGDGLPDALSRGPSPTNVAVWSPTAPGTVDDIGSGTGPHTTDDLHRSAENGCNPYPGRRHAAYPPGTTSRARDTAPSLITELTEYPGAQPAP
jgi:hypothetical protein